MRKDKGFQRYGRGVYKCAICDRSTRATLNNCNDHLCAECFELAGLENMLNDNGEEEARHWGVIAERNDLFAKMTKLGSNPEKVRANFPELFALA